MSKQNRNAEKKPLMYIVQADYSDTQSSMQDILIKKGKRRSRRKKSRCMESGRKNVKLSLKEQWLSNQKSKYLNSTAAQKKPFKKFRRKRAGHCQA